MEDDLTSLGKWKTTSIFLKMEDNLIFFGNGERAQICLMEDNLIFKKNGRQHQFF